MPIIRSLDLSHLAGVAVLYRKVFLVFKSAEISFFLTLFSLWWVPLNSIFFRLMFSSFSVRVCVLCSKVYTLYFCYLSFNDSIFFWSKFETCFQKQNIQLVKHHTEYWLQLSASSTPRNTPFYRGRVSVLNKIHVPGYAITCLMSYANSKGADQRAHARNLISAFVFRCLDSIMPLVSISEILRLQLVAVAEQTGIPGRKSPNTRFRVWLIWKFSSIPYVTCIHIPGAWP